MIPVFIGGTGRCGTTILKRVLDCHSGVASIPHELRFIVDPGGAIELVAGLSTNWSPYSADAALHRFRRLLSDLLATPRSTGIAARALRKGLMTLGVSPWRYGFVDPAFAGGRQAALRGVDRLIEELTHHSSRGVWVGSPPFQIPSVIHEAPPMDPDAAARRIGRFVCELIEQGPHSGATTHWVEDTPYNVLHAVPLRQMFPQARLIHMLRDPRDVVASMVTKDWGGDEVAGVAQRVADVLARWCTIRKHVPEEFFLEVRLERLSADPPGQLSRICARLDLPFQASLLRIQLDQVHAGRWRRELTGDQQIRVQSILQETLTRFDWPD